MDRWFLPILAAVIAWPASASGQLPVQDCSQLWGDSSAMFLSEPCRLQPDASTQFDGEQVDVAIISPFVPNPLNPTMFTEDPSRVFEVQKNESDGTLYVAMGDEQWPLKRTSIFVSQRLGQPTAFDRRACFTGQDFEERSPSSYRHGTDWLFSDIVDNGRWDTLFGRDRSDWVNDNFVQRGLVGQFPYGEPLFVKRDASDGIQEGDELIQLWKPKISKVSWFDEGTTGPTECVDAAIDPTWRTFEHRDALPPQPCDSDNSNCHLADMFWPASTAESCVSGVRRYASSFIPLFGGYDGHVFEGLAPEANFEVIRWTQQETWSTDSEGTYNLEINIQEGLQRALRLLEQRDEVPDVVVIAPPFTRRPDALLPPMGRDTVERSLEALRSRGALIVHGAGMARFGQSAQSPPSTSHEFTLQMPEDGCVGACTECGPRYSALEGSISWTGDAVGAIRFRRPGVSQAAEITFNTAQSPGSGGTAESVTFDQWVGGPSERIVYELQRVGDGWTLLFDIEQQADLLDAESNVCQDGSGAALPAALAHESPWDITVQFIEPEGGPASNVALRLHDAYAPQQPTAYVRPSTVSDTRVATHLPAGSLHTAGTLEPGMTVGSYALTGQRRWAEEGAQAFARWTVERGREMLPQSGVGPSLDGRRGVDLLAPAHGFLHSVWDRGLGGMCAIRTEAGDDCVAIISEEECSDSPPDDIPASNVPRQVASMPFQLYVYGDFQLNSLMYAAGSAAILREAHPNATVQQIETALYRSARPLDRGPVNGPTPNLMEGHGRLDVDGGLDYLNSLLAASEPQSASADADLRPPQESDQSRGPGALGPSGCATTGAAGRPTPWILLLVLGVACMRHRRGGGDRRA